MQDPLKPGDRLTFGFTDTFSWTYRHPSFDDFTWYEQQLARFTYKRGWTFRIEQGWGYPVIVAIMEVEDTYHPGVMVKVSGPSRPLLNIDRREEVFAHVVQQLVRDMEIHEADEWLKRDGEIYDNPHTRRI